MFWGNWSDWEFGCDWLIESKHLDDCAHCRACGWTPWTPYARWWARLYDQVLMGTMREGWNHVLGRLVRLEL